MSGVVDRGWIYLELRKEAIRAQEEPGIDPVASKPIRFDIIDIEDTISVPADLARRFESARAARSGSERQCWVRGQAANEGNSSGTGGHLDKGRIPCHRLTYPR